MSIKGKEEHDIVEWIEKMGNRCTWIGATNVKFNNEEDLIIFKLIFGL